MSFKEILFDMNITSPAGPVDRILLTGPWGRFLLLHVTLTTLLLFFLYLFLVFTPYFIFLYFFSYVFLLNVLLYHLHPNQRDSYYSMSHSQLYCFSSRISFLCIFPVILSIFLSCFSFPYSSSPSISYGSS